MLVLGVFCFALWGYNHGQSVPFFMRASLPPVMTLSAQVGDNVQLDCSYDGQPRPDIFWYKYNIPLSDITYRILENTVKLGKLVLSEILLADAGNYSCFVKNMLGSINRTFILNVHESSNSRPVIHKSLMTNETVVLGGEAIFHCHVTSDSVTYVRWYFKRHTGQLNTSDNSNQTTVPEIVSLVPVKILNGVKNGHSYKGEAVFLVNNVSRHDEGEYICEAFNQRGKVRCGAFLLIVEGSRPSPHELEAKYAAALFGKRQEFPLAVVVAIPVFFLIILTAVFIRALERAKQKHGVGLVKKTDMNGDVVVMNHSCGDKESTNQKIEKEVVITEPRRVLNYAKRNGVQSGQQITQLSKQVTCAVAARGSSERLPSSQASDVGSKRCSAALELEWDGIELDMEEGFQMIKLSKEEDV